MFLRYKDKDLDIKSAYFHLMSEAIVSAGIVIGGITIFYPQWFWIDSVLSIVITTVILLSTWRLIKDCFRLWLDGVSEKININKIKTIATKLNDVKDLHHIHIWAINTTENALTGHLVLELGLSIEDE